MKNLSLFIYILIVSFTMSCNEKAKIQANDIQFALKNIEKVNKLTIMNDSKYNSFPQEIYKLEKLNVLIFIGSECDNGDPKCMNITQIPKGLKRLSNLKELILVMNNIKIITDEINDLKNLEYLDLSNNPSINVDNLSNANLKVLNLNGCNLKKIPKGIIKMKKLKGLGLEGNFIEESTIRELKIKFPNCEISW
jgi:Leucine-rich repeat (LRR) protein